MVDINRSTTGVLLPAEVAQDIWSVAQADSVVMQLAQRLELPGAGKQFQLITGDGEASFVGETARKPLSNPTFSSKTMTPHKIALVHSFSDEFQRDKARLYAALRPRMARDIARAFDLAALHGIGAPTGGFDTLADSPTRSINTAGTVYDALVNALGDVAAADGDLTAWALAPQAEVKVLLEKDASDRPLFITSTTNERTFGSMLGRPVVKNRNVYTADDAATAEGTVAGTVDSETLGIGGDWTQAYWGTVEGIKYEEYGGPIYDGSGNLVHAGRQDNMFSVISEVEVGFVTRDDDLFVRLIGADAGA